LKTILTVSLAFALAAVVSGRTFAQQPPTDQPPAATKTPVSPMAAVKAMMDSVRKMNPEGMKAVWFKGTVVSVDPNANTIVVKGKDKKEMEKTFLVNDLTRLTMNKKPAVLSDYAAGTKVAVTYDMENGKMVAYEIR
jgi:hypothetical protein